MEDLYQKYLACGGRVTTDSRAIAGGGIVVDDRPGGAGLQGLEGVVIAVEILSPQGEEDLPAPDRPAVGGDPVAAVAVFCIQFFHVDAI